MLSQLDILKFLEWLYFCHLGTFAQQCLVFLSDPGQVDFLLDFRYVLRRSGEFELGQSSFDFL